ncbi:MAG: helix-turn-helix domain-containing protein [bacterium]|nr:helix-turn-helix domain-containing protein [bacterium]
MAKSKEKIIAHRLRRKGWSLSDISKKINISKSTVSLWCRDLKLTKKENSLLLNNIIKSGHKGRIAGANANRKKKEVLIDFYNKSGKKNIGDISRRELMMLGAALYWAEGSKNGKFSFSNSDPDMILFICAWLKDAMKIKKEDFMPRIFINDTHRPRIKKVLRYWSGLLKLPIEQFGNPTFLKIRQKKVYDNHDNYYGVLALRIRRSSKLRYHVLGLIDAIKRQNKPM